MSNHVFGRSCTGVLPTAVAGDGCWIIDSDGKRYLKFYIPLPMLTPIGQEQCDAS